MTTKTAQRKEVPEFFELLREAHGASEAVDHFDLDSQDAASLASFEMLTVQQNRAITELLAHVNAHGDFILGFLREPRSTGDTVKTHRRSRGKKTRKRG